MVAVVIISLTLLGLSGLLIDSHRRTWREARESTSLSEADKSFARAMYLRRMQASAMVGVMGAAIGIWPAVDQQARPWTLLLYTAILLVACAWSMALAMFDIWATRRHFHRKRMESLSKQLQQTVEMAAADGSSAEAEGQA
jgi:Tfp pilus assembly protein PilV